MPLVLDCVPYFNERRIWQLRYETLRDVVDGFVVVEANHTHSGQPKALTFRAPDAVPPVFVWDVDLPEPGAPGIPATRRREMHQRNAIASAVRSECGPIDDDTILLISDCDEIPHPAAVAHLRQHGLDDGQVVVFRQNLFYYDLNTTAGYVWNGTRAARWADVRALSPHVIRYGLGAHDAQYPQHLVAHPGGWHLSYFGGADAVRAKMQAFLHQELVTPEAIAEAERRIAAGVDVWGRDDGHQFARGLAVDAPPPVVADPHAWRDLFHPEYAPKEG